MYDELESDNNSLLWRKQGEPVTSPLLAVLIEALFGLQSHEEKGCAAMFSDLLKVGPTEPHVTPQVLSATSNNFDPSEAHAGRSQGELLADVRPAPADIF